MPETLSLEQFEERFPGTPPVPRRKPAVETLSIEDFERRFPQPETLSVEEFEAREPQPEGETLTVEEFERRTPGLPGPGRKPEIRRLRPGEFIQNPDGSRSTERSITVTEQAINQGRPTNIPSIFSIGGESREVPQEQAVRFAFATGEQFPSFDTMEQAVEAAKARSAAGGRFSDQASPVLESPSLTRSALNAIVQGAAGGVAAFPETVGIERQVAAQGMLEQFDKVDQGQLPH